MKKFKLTKKILLGLAIFSMPFATAQASIITPGSYTGGTITVPNGQTVISAIGTYNIDNSTQTLDIINGGSSLNIFNISSGGTANVNGSINAQLSNFTGSGTNQISNGTVNVTGNFNLEANNSTLDTSWGRLMSIDGGTTNTVNFNVGGDLTVKNHVNSASSSFSLLTVMGANTTLTVEGNLYMYNRINTGASISGSNTLYANNGGTIVVNGNKAYIHSISSNPDGITAKNLSNITLNSTETQVIGNLSFIEVNSSGGLLNKLHPGGNITATFDGPNSFWYGDEQNYLPIWAVTNGIPGTLDFTFKNGAEWIYFGDDCTYTLPLFGLVDCAQAKYVSAITLENGGIVNLQDSDIHTKLTAIEGLTEAKASLLTNKHDFVTIGDLKGSDGVFKLDIVASDRTQSDMVFVQASTNPGQHSILANITEDEILAISDTNTVRFATVAQAANGVTFNAKKLAFNDSLVEYDLLVNSETFDSADPNNALYNDRYTTAGGNTTAILNSITNNGTNWYLYGYTKTVAPIVDDLIVDTPTISYDFVFDADLDTLNKRQGEANYITDKSDGIWVRMQRRSDERKDVSAGTSTKYQIGYDKILGGGKNRAGIAFDYKKGTSYSLSQTSSQNSSRKAISIYNTTTLNDNNGYLDIVGRYGWLNHDFDILRDNGSTVSGDYDNKTMSLSVEYGQPIDLSAKAFIEPQVQFQYAHVTSSDYTTNTGFFGGADAANSFIGRLGFRLGQKSDKGLVYFKANVLHEFTGGQDTFISDGKNHFASSVDSRGTWYDVGIGGNYKLSPASYIFADIEKSFGSKVKGWQVNVGANFNF